MNFDESTLIGLGAALGAGLLIGIERERRKGSGPQRALAGARTFTLTSLAGAIAFALEQPWLVAIGALLILVLAAIGYWRNKSDDPGITTELALFVTYLLGVTAVDHPALAAGSSVIVTALLAARRYLHEFSIEVITDIELRDALIFAGAALVILPLLPDHSIVWLADINPRKLWGLVLLFMGVQAAGYIGLRVAGPNLGLALSALASGFVSSAATIAALGVRARQDRTLLLPCVAGALFSTVATMALLAIISAVVYLPTLKVVAPTVILGLLTAVGAAFFVLRGQLASSRESPHELPRGRAFNVFYAIGLAALLMVVTATMSYLHDRFGHLAVDLSAALAGFFDVHASAASVFSLVASGQVEVASILKPLLIAVMTNTATKIVAAYVGGGAAYAVRVAAGLILVLAAACAPLLFYKI
jgi:uncharacterized membrane protein (DUF4010 family)